MHERQRTEAGDVDFRDKVMHSGMSDMAFSMSSHLMAEL